MIDSALDCIYLNTVNDTTNWATNISNPTLSVIAYWIPILLNYKEWDVIIDDINITYYRYCGAFAQTTAQKLIKKNIEY